ncbi:MAG TPA: dihydropteroate synthase [Miltoncostaeaceae bacterium]|nr:dihydropteroate synthase [Miltoncostaeaceae bacterium]
MTTGPGHDPLGWLRPPCVMGIVNVTPDSFSGGDASLDPGAARSLVDAQAAAGAAICDVGAESTRPGADRVPPAEQLRRLAPLLDVLRARPPGVALSVDTTRAPVAAAALRAGAVLVNDVSAGREDPAILELVAERGAAVCLMHMRGQPRDMQDDPRYGDVVAEVEAFLAGRVEEAVRRGVPRARILLDPGIGFGKTLAHNLDLLRALPRLRRLGHPLVVGVSRKGMIGALTGRPVAERAAGSVGGALAAVAGGADVVRVHDVPATVDALAVWCAVRTGGAHEEASGRPHGAAAAARGGDGG